MHQKWWVARRTPNGNDEPNDELDELKMTCAAQWGAGEYTGWKAEFTGEGGES